MKKLILALVMAIPGCGEEAPPVQAGGVVDSIFPVEEEIRRFKATLVDAPPTELANARASKEELAAAFVAALEATDTVQLHGLTITPWEFIEFYYPSSEYTKPPYKQSPATMWFLMQNSSGKGISRALTRFGGKPAGYQRLECPDSGRQQNGNTLWERCLVRWQEAPGKPDPISLFGTIFERAGRFKFLSYANDL